MIWAAPVALLALALVAYGFFEAGWLRCRVLEVEIEGLPKSLDGLRVAHLSDFHLGVPSRGRVATERAVAWVAERRPDLVCITGDLVSHPRGVPAARSAAGHARPALRRPRQSRCCGHARSVLARRGARRPREVALLLRDEAACVERGGQRIQIVGVDAESYPRRDGPTLGARRPPMPTSASCSVTSPGSSAGSLPVPSTSCSRGTCTRVRSSFRTRAGG